MIEIIGGEFSGLRIRHEVVDERVMLVSVEYAEQTYRAARRSRTVVEPLFGHDDESYERCLDWLHRTAGELPLVSP